MHRCHLDHSNFLNFKIFSGIWPRYYTKNGDKFPETRLKFPEFRKFPEKRHICNKHNNVSPDVKCLELLVISVKWDDLEETVIKPQADHAALGIDDTNRTSL